VDFLQAAAAIALPIASAIDSEKTLSIRWKCNKTPSLLHTLTAIAHQQRGGNRLIGFRQSHYSKPAALLDYLGISPHKGC